MREVRQNQEANVKQKGKTLKIYKYKTEKKKKQKKNQGNFS